MPAEKQQEVLDFAESLQEKAGSKQPCTSLKGLCADLNLDLTDEEIAAARREMWGASPGTLHDGVGGRAHARLRLGGRWRGDAAGATE